METEFLNFRDEERFSAYDSFDYQESNGILEWSSITGIKNEYSYNTQSSRDSMDDSGAYWADEEQELNGDIAVIPVSGRLDHVFPHLSTSPECKEDFQKMLNDWHEHIGALEGSDTEDHISIVTNHEDDLSMSHIDYAPTPKIHNSSPYRQSSLDADVLSIQSTPLKIKSESVEDDSAKFQPDTFHSPFSIQSDTHLNSSLSEMELNLGHSTLKIDIDSIVKVEDDILMKTEPVDNNEVCSFNGDLKNFDLVTAVVKDEIDLNLSIDSDKNQEYHLPKFDSPLKDNFNLTSYIKSNEKHCILNDIKSATKMFNENSAEEICSEIKQVDKKCLNDASFKSKNKTNKNKSKSKKSVKKLSCEQSPLKVDIEDDCIDVETVSPTGIHPVIEAGDLTTLLEQFEASEAVNTTSKRVQDTDVYSQTINATCNKSDRKKLTSDKVQYLSEKNANKKYKKMMRFDNNESVPKDVLERIRASGKKKPITVIPAMPAKKLTKSIRAQDSDVSSKTPWLMPGYSSPGEKSIQLDHNYCTTSPTKSPSKLTNLSTGSSTNSDIRNVESVTEYYKVLKKPNVVGRGIGSKGIRCPDIGESSLDAKNDSGIDALETNIQTSIENKDLKTVIISKKCISDTTMRMQNRNEIIIRKQISPNKIVKTSPTTPTKLKLMPQSRTIITQGSLLKNGGRVQQSLLAVNQKSVLMKNATASQQQSLLKSNATANFKNVDGKVMVSVLKTNNKNLSQNANKTVVNAVVDTTTPNDKCVRNIIIDETINCTKKRKLNLEEYKKRREIGRTAHSCNTSRTNSPIGFVPSGNLSPMVHHGSFSLPVTAVGSPISQPGTPVYETIEPTKKVEPKKLSPEEKLLKMAADILTTPAKSSVNSSDVKYTIEPFTEPKPESEQPVETPKLPMKEESTTETVSVPPKPINEDFEMLTIVSIGVNTIESCFSQNTLGSAELEKTKANVEMPTISFKIKKNEVLTRNKFFDSWSNENSESASSENKSVTAIKPVDKNLQDGKPNKTLSNCKQSGTVNKDKLTEMIAPILQNANTKINSNSLISNITATILKKKPESVLLTKNTGVAQKAMKQDNNLKIKQEVDQMPPEHGEDKTVIILDKKRPKPVTCDIEIQTDLIEEAFDDGDKKKMEKTEVKVLSNDRKCRQYRSRRVSSSSSSSNVSNRSLRLSRKNFRSSSVVRSRRRSQRTSSTRSSHRRSVSSLGSSRWSRSSQSRSRSRSRSYSRSYSRSSYSSMSSRSPSPSPSSTRRRRLDSRRSSSSRYSRTRRRSRSNYRNYRHSRSPFNRGPRGRNGRSWESVEREKLRQVEERRVIYVGRLELGTTKADLRRLFQKFGPVIEVSVHFRDQGDNYGFVTFAYQEDAYEAIEQGTIDPDLVHYDISFGGRRAFCKTRYSDLDNSDAIEMNSYRPMQEDSSFDMLLKEAQAKLRKRKA